MSRGRNYGKKPPDIGLQMECHEEALTPEQAAAYNKGEKEYKEVTAKLEQMMKNLGAELVEKGSETVYVIQMNSSPPASVPTLSPATPTPTNTVGTPVTRQTASLIAQPTPAQTPTGPVILQTPPSIQTRSAVQTRTNTVRGNTPITPAQPNKITISNTPSAPSPPTVPSLRIKPPKPPTNQKAAPAKTPPVAPNKGGPNASNRPTEGNSVGGLSTGPGSKPWRPQTAGSVSAPVVDLTDDDGRPSNNTVAADSREVTFNKLSGKTFPSLVVVARPHLRIKDMAQGTVSLERAALGRRGARGKNIVPETDAKSSSRSKSKAGKKRKKHGEHLQMKRATRSQVKEELEPQYVVEMVGRQTVRFAKEASWHLRKRIREDTVTRKTQKRDSSELLEGKQKKIRIIEPQAPPVVRLEKKVRKSRKRRSK